VEAMKDYILDVVLANIKKNIKEWLSESNEYFQEVEELATILSEDDKMLREFVENMDFLILVTNDILSDIKKLPYISDLRDYVNLKFI